MTEKEKKYRRGRETDLDVECKRVNVTEKERKRKRKKMRMRERKKERKRGDETRNHFLFLHSFLYGLKRDSRAWYKGKKRNSSYRSAAVSLSATRILSDF